MSLTKENTWLALVQPLTKGATTRILLVDSREGQVGKFYVGLDLQEIIDYLELGGKKIHDWLVDAANDKIEKEPHVGAN